MSIEIVKERDEKVEPPIKKQESIKVLKKSLEEEIFSSVDNFNNQDEEVKEIERNVDLNNGPLVEEIKKEIHLKESLQQINSEAEKLKNNILNELNTEESSGGKVESVEEKIKKVEDLFNNLNTRELEREDIETHERGWNVTNNLEAVEKFKRDTLESLSENKNSLFEAPCFKKLIDQKSYQDIIWIASSICPEIFNRYEANLKFNAFIQERPEFLESEEFRKVCLEHLKGGIEHSTIFEGYINKEKNKNNTTPTKSKVNYFEEDDDWSVMKIEENSFVKDKNIKTKITEIPSNNEKLIINLDLYEYDSSQIDSLDEKEKDELRGIFLKKIQSLNTYHYPGKIFGDEVILVGEKLGFTEEYMNEQIFNSMLRGVSKSKPPTDGIDKEFPEVYKKIQETLLDQEKRENLLNLTCENICSTDKYFHHWKDSFNYINLSKEELEKAKDAYLDFSSGDIFYDKVNGIFGYSWSKEEDFYFSKEEKLRAFETMNSSQRSCIISTYSGSMEKISYLPFTQNDILEFALNEINSAKYASNNEIYAAEAKIGKNFPGIFIDTKEVLKKLAFKSDSITEIQEFLTKNSIEMSPQEILDQFDSPEDFVLKHIAGADLSKLKGLEEFKNSPGAPELPYLPDELFNEIKQHITKQKNNYRDDTYKLKEIISFVPGKYKFEVWNSPDLQEAFSNYYAQALKNNDQEFIHDLGFLIPKSETLYNAEQRVFDEYFQKKDYYNIIKYHEILFENDRSSPIIKKIEELFKEKIETYNVEAKIDVLNHYNLEKTLQDASLQKLNELSPDNLQKDELIEEWFNIVYGSKSKEASNAFNLIKNSKDFSYFDKKIMELLFNGTLSEKFIGTLQGPTASNSESIDRAVEFNKDMKKIFDRGFSEKNYDYLYKKLSGLSPEEYEKNIHLLEEIKPLISSPLISNIKFDNLFNEVSLYNEPEQKKFFDLINTTTYGVDPENDLGWAKNTIIYVNEVEELGVLHRDQNKKDKMINLFSGDYKNIALREMAGEWKDFLKNDENILSPQIRLVSKIIDEAGGAGNMKHIESLGNLVSQIQSTLDNGKTTSRTIQEIKGMMAGLEDRFSKEKWLQDDISEFYNLSKDILEAAPSLYTTLRPIFENISSAKDMKKFMSDVFPFYQTQLVIKQNIDGDNTNYNPRDLVEMRNSIREFAGTLTQDKTEKSDVFESEKLRLLEIAKDGFKNRFGLLKIPDNFTKENLRSIQNTIRYMGNISGRTPEREALISLYLGLELDNKWGDFRGGKQINFSEYISEKQLQIIAPLLEKKKESYKLISEVSGLDMDKMSKFQDLLQADVSNNLIGDIQTIDIKLGNIKRNIDELVDPDIYQTQKEKMVLSIFSTEGKNVNAVLSKLYGVSIGRNIQLSEEENKIKQKIEDIFNVKEWTPDKVKEIQEEIQPIGLVTSMVNKMQEEKVEENISELQTRLIPSGQIIEIFNKLGEEFHQESGALALSRDLSYLENIIVKDENKITNEEKEIVNGYIESVREKMKDMENVLDHVKQYFEKIKKSSHVDSNPVLKSRIAEIEKVIYSQDTSAVITSQMTKDLNSIIENMRQCLGCMRKEANNDTNLSFGDYNKFFMMNQSEKEKGSISDEIVFFVPITTPDGSKEMSFVMDRVYGSKSSDVLIGNISAVYKKYSVLKKEFPDARLSVSVTSAAMTSVGLNADILEKRLKDILNKKIEIKIFEELNALIPKSSLSDNYVEFGNDASARQSGERQFSGLLIK